MKWVMWMLAMAATTSAVTPVVAAEAPSSGHHGAGQLSAWREKPRHAVAHNTGRQADKGISRNDAAAGEAVRQDREDEHDHKGD